MPYLALHFDSDTEASIRTVAGSIAAGSAFAPQPPSAYFHVPLIGSLHKYTIDEVHQHSLLQTPIVGRFVRWDIQSNQLRVAIEFDAKSAHELSQKASTLPLGRPWRSLYTVLGSVSAISPNQRDEFLKALQATFPLNETQSFSCGGALHLHDRDPTGPVHKPKSKRSSPATKTKPSPHLKWVKPQEGAPANHDVTMRPVASAIRKKQKKQKATQQNKSHQSHKQMASRRVVVR